MHDLDQLLARRRLEAGRVLEREVVAEQLAGRGQPVGRARRRRRRPSANSSATSGVLGEQLLPRRGQQLARRLERCARRAGRSNSCSSTACTTVPRIAARDGASGSRSIVRKR